MAQQYRIVNFITGLFEYFDLEKDATDRIKVLESEVMTLQAGRFNITYIEKLPLGENWGALTEESPEDGIYRVFISETGLHEEYQKKSEALAKNQELKDAFLASLAQTPVLADPLKQPSSTGTQTL
jgi:hypothetical protein